MSITVSILTLGGIALASDGRRILVEPEKENNIGDDYEILDDNTPKVNLLCGRYALTYTGVSRLAHGRWDLKDEIPTLERFLGGGKYSVKEAAAYLNERLSGLLCTSEREKAYSFTLSGYKQGFPVLIEYKNGELGRELGLKENGDFQFGFICAGFVDNIKKITAGQRIDINNMTVMEAFEFAELLVNLEIKCRKYFKDQKEYCGGKVTVAVITRDQCGFIERLPTGEFYIVEEKPRMIS